MSNPIEYYGCDTTNDPLMLNIVNTWGHGLENMSAVDKAYLLWQLPEHYLLRLYPDQLISDEIERFCELLGEEALDLSAQTALLRALTNRTYGKPLGYWGLDYENPLINYLYQQYGDGLAGINITDAYMIIATIGMTLCQSFHVFNHNVVTDEVEQIGDAIANYELPEDQVHALIQALGDS